MSLPCLSAAIAVEVWQEGFPCPEDTGPGLPSFLALARPLAVAYPQQRSPASISSSRAARSFIWFWQMLCFCHKSQDCRRLRLHSSTSSSYNIKTAQGCGSAPRDYPTPEQVTSVTSRTEKFISSSVYLAKFNCSCGISLVGQFLDLPGLRLGPQRLPNNLQLEQQ